jgi:hypothetical protein
LTCGVPVGWPGTVTVTSVSRRSTVITPPLNCPKYRPGTARWLNEKFHDRGFAMHHNDYFLAAPHQRPARSRSARCTRDVWSTTGWERSDARNACRTYRSAGCLARSGPTHCPQRAITAGVVVDAKVAVCLQAGIRLASALSDCGAASARRSATWLSAHRGFGAITCAHAESSTRVCVTRSTCHLVPSRQTLHEMGSIRPLPRRSLHQRRHRPPHPMPVYVLCQPLAQRCEHSSCE